jgi:threonine dehydrogenase-like Zn-dependent dehydrogenase
VRSLQLLGASRAELRDAPEPQPPPDGVIVAMRASALCGSELHAYREIDVRPGLTNLGHEAVGVVADASRSRRWKEGDRVGVHAVWGCGQCVECAAGRYTYCARRTVAVGAHAECIAAPDRALLALPDDTDFAVGALLTGDTLGVPYHASRRLGVREGETVVVVGCGPIGLASILFHAFQRARVIALDLRPERRALAKRAGAEVVIDPTLDDPVAAVRSRSGGRLADASIEASGTPAGVALALAVVGPGRPVALCGEARAVTVDVSRDLLREDRTIFGSWYYHYAEYPEMVALLRSGLPLRELISHRFAFTDAPAALATFAGGATGKVVLEIDQDKT